MVSSLIFQNFSGEGLTEPLPRPFPPLFLGLGFAHNSRALCVLDSGFALNFRLGTLVCPPPPQNKFLDPPVIKVTVFKYFQTVAIYIAPNASFLV